MQAGNSAVFVDIFWESFFRIYFVQQWKYNIYVYRVIVTSTIPNKAEKVAMFLDEVGDWFYPLSDNPEKWSNTLKQFVGYCRRIVWVSLTFFGGLALKTLKASANASLNHFKLNCKNK